jgi:hypothetical protein
MGSAVFPYPAHSPHLAPSDYHLFGPVKDALHGRHVADDNELKQSFRGVLRVEEGNFKTLVHNALHNDGKRVLKITYASYKNTLTIAKHGPIFHVNFTVTLISFSEKNGGTTIVQPLVPYIKS